MEKTIYGGAVNARREVDGKGIQVFSDDGSGKPFLVENIRLSSETDPYQPGHNYGGIILYGCDGKSDWKTENGTHCESGYMVIKDTDCKPTPQDKYENEPGRVHGAIYRDVFGESCTQKKVVGEGFGVMDGEVKTVSGVFNAAADHYHDGSSWMNPESEKCVKEGVEKWMAAGNRFSGSEVYRI